jgi:hypothetical protein
VLQKERERGAGELHVGDDLLPSSERKDKLLLELCSKTSPTQTVLRYAAVRYS